MGNINNKQNKNYYEEDIYIRALFNACIREKKIIISLTSLITIATIVFSFFVRPIYRGRFEIVIMNPNKNEALNTRASILDPAMMQALSIRGLNENNKTQEFILKSPSVLMSVYDYDKQINPLLKGKNISYGEWIESKLTIKFKEKSNVLEVFYKDQNKENIIKILNSISSKYKDYSLADRNRTIDNAIRYLSEQKSIYKINSKKSMRDLNRFSIENGLGDIEGFVTLGYENIKMEPMMRNDLVSIEGKVSTNDKSTAGFRYKNQFAILEKYEALYTNLSSKLKPEAKTLIDLKLKINNLKESLKRPNQILVEFRELKKLALRDERTLDDIERKLSYMELEKIRQQAPWSLISNPTLEKSRLYPQRKLMAIVAFLTGLVLSLLIAIFKDKKTNLIFEIEELKFLLDCNYLETIYLKNKLLSNQLIKSLFNENESSKNSYEGIIYLNLKNYESNLKSFLFKESNNYLKINFQDESTIKKCDNLILITSNGVLKREDIEIINKYIRVYKEKIIGWCYLNTTVDINT